MMNFVDTVRTLSQIRCAARIDKLLKFTVVTQDNIQEIDTWVREFTDVPFNLTPRFINMLRRLFSFKEERKLSDWDIKRLLTEIRSTKARFLIKTKNGHTLHKILFQ